MKMTVVYLIDPKDSKAFAWFPEEPASGIDPILTTIYTHVGQHGAAHPDFLATCRQATEAEADDIRREVEWIYQDDPDDPVQLVEMRKERTMSSSNRKVIMTQSTKLIVYACCPPSADGHFWICLLYTSPSPRDRTRSRMPSSA